MMRSFGGPKNTVPNLVVAQRVLDKMSRAAQAYAMDETGEALVGLIVPGKHTNGVDTIYVLDTIAPNESAVRDLHTFQQGDWDQEEILIWLQENWRSYRETGRNSAGETLLPKWDVPLRYLGDWHKQPGYMIAPSGGDQRTALAWLDDPENDMDFMLAPIVTTGHPSTTLSAGSGANFVTVQQGSEQHLRIDFWFIERKLGLFQPIVPVRYPDDLLPGLPDYPWHLVNRERADKEFAGLAAENLFTSIILWRTGEHTPPLDVCFMLARMGADRILILMTPWNYPQSAPKARVAPFMPIKQDQDLGEFFEAMWAESEPVEDPSDWTWDESKLLVEYVRVLEAALGIEVPSVEQPDEDTVTEEPS